MSTNSCDRGKIVFTRSTMLLVLLAVLVVFAAVGVGIYRNMSGDADERALTIQDVDPAEENSTNLTSGVLFLDGKQYTYNDHLSNYLFLGVDKSHLDTVDIGSAEAGQTDAVYLLSVDRVTQKTTLISIPRDTMTRITTYAVGATTPDYRYDHLSICYGYGDGRFTSCEMTRDAVSNLLCHLPIQNYCAIGLDALTVLAENVDEVQITVTENTDAFPAEEFTAGETITITPDNIESFLRTRDINEAQSAIYRLERQKVYLRAVLERCEGLYRQDPGFISDLYLDLKSQMVTNMSTDHFVDIMESIVSGGGPEEWTLPGEGVETELYDEFRVDRQELYRKLIETCCVPVE